MFGKKVNRDVNILIRATKEERAAVIQLAKERGHKTLASYIRTLIVEDIDKSRVDKDDL